VVVRPKKSEKPRELLFSVGAADCRFDYFRGSGKGGQKRNKTSSAVRVTHLASEAVGRSDDTRSQHRNKQIAFKRMSESERFKKWHRIETARRMGRLQEAQDAVDLALRATNLLVEGKTEGKWAPLPKL